MDVTLKVHVCNDTVLTKYPKIKNIRAKIKSAFILQTQLLQDNCSNQWNGCKTTNQLPTLCSNVLTDPQFTTISKILVY